MNKFALAIALGAATLLSGAAANAAGTTAKSDRVVSTGAAAGTHQATDFSSRHRRHWRHRHWHRYGYYRPYYRPYYRSYGYYPRSYGYYPGYYNPAPAVSFGFGFGGPRFHHRHWW